MKKAFIFVFLVAMTIPVFAQKNGSNVFSIKHHWTKTIGYSYQPGYIYGFSLAGGSFMSVGFAEDGKEYPISATEKREPTWSMRFGWIGYSFDEDVTGWGAITFRPFVNMGMDFMKHYTMSASGWDSETKTYFTFAPSLAVNVYMFNFFVGYEFVPRFKELNGINFGAGFSIPLKSSQPATLQGTTTHTQ